MSIFGQHYSGRQLLIIMGMAFLGLFVTMWLVRHFG